MRARLLTASESQQSSVDVEVRSPSVVLIRFDMPRRPRDCKGGCRTGHDSLVIAAAGAYVSYTQERLAPGRVHGMGPLEEGGGGGWIAEEESRLAGQTETAGSLRTPRVLASRVRLERLDRGSVEAEVMEFAAEVVEPAGTAVVREDIQRETRQVVPLLLASPDMANGKSVGRTFEKRGPRGLVCVGPREEPFVGTPFPAVEPAVRETACPE